MYNFIGGAQALPPDIGTAAATSYSYLRDRLHTSTAGRGGHLSHRSAGNCAWITAAAGWVRAGGGKGQLRNLVSSRRGSQRSKRSATRWITITLQVLPHPADDQFWKSRRSWGGGISRRTSKRWDSRKIFLHQGTGTYRCARFCFSIKVHCCLLLSTVVYYDNIQQ